jgi:hypothetical protein
VIVTTAAAPTPAGKITCDEVVPQAVRDKHFAGQELSEQPAMVASLMQVACSFSKEMDIHTISVTCHPDWPQSTWDTVEAEMKKQVADAKDAAVGKNGWSGTFAGGAHVHTLDDDTACSIDVHGDGDLAAITTDVVASLKPEALAN